MFPASLATTPADVMVAVFDAKDAPHALRLATTLRTAGLRVMVYPDADKIGKQIKYADAQGIPYVAILGSDEIAAEHGDGQEPQGRRPRTPTTRPRRARRFSRD